MKIENRNTNKFLLFLEFFMNALNFTNRQKHTKNKEHTDELINKQTKNRQTNRQTNKGQTE